MSRMIKTVSISVFTMAALLISAAGAKAFTQRDVPQLQGAGPVSAREFREVQSTRDDFNTERDTQALTAEEREALQQRVLEYRKRMDAMSAERFGASGADSHWRAMFQERRQQIEQKIEEKYGHLSEAERAEKLEELREKRQALRRELEQLPPEARKARMEELRREFDASQDSGQPQPPSQD